MYKVLLVSVLLSVSLFAKMFQSVPEAKAHIVQTGKEARYCSSCGMDLVKFYRTSHSAKVDGKQKQYCSIHCLEKTLKSGAKVTDIKVVDTKTLQWIDATKAYYVVGSSKKGTMSRVSKYAFANKADAEAFQKEFGGKIMDFHQALEVAKKDFK
jgi:nitrous oxide reductase accessory protein NosL